MMAAAAPASAAVMTSPPRPPGEPRRSERRGGDGKGIGGTAAGEGYVSGSPHVQQGTAGWGSGSVREETDPLGRPPAIAWRAKRGLDWPPMPSSTVENYVKRLYMEQQRSPERLVPMGRLAAVMGVVPGTVTTMVKALDEERLVHYEPRSGVRLTRSGEKLALHVLRRHRLVELFLVKALGLDWSEVHEEAEVLEHAVSEK